MNKKGSRVKEMKWESIRNIMETVIIDYVS